jgi:hypothetical protein
MEEVFEPILEAEIEKGYRRPKYSTLLPDV